MVPLQLQFNEVRVLPDASLEPGLCVVARRAALVDGGVCRWGG